MAQQADDQLRQRIIAGSLWYVALRWSVRGLTLARTVTLARLLSPVEVGLVSMAVLTMLLFEVVSDISVDTALIRMPSATRAHFDTAWTLRMLQRLAIASAVFLVAPLSARFFGEPAIVPMIRVMALGPVLWAFENIGTVNFRRDLDFRREAMVSGINSLVALAATISAAFLLRNAWALVVAFLVERASYSAVSYLAHPYRPKPSLAVAREILSFSQWVPMQSTGRFLRNRLDGFFVARFCGAAAMGVYSMGAGAAYTVSELMDPLSGPLLSGYAKRTSDGRRLAAAYAAALGMVGSLYLPAAVGMAMIAPNVVAVILGERWLDAVPIVRALAIYHLVLGLAGQGDDVLRALGRMRRLTATIYIQLAVSAPLLFLAARTGDAAVVAAAKAGAAFLIAPILLWALIQVSSVSARLIAAALIRPLLASAAMAGVLWLVRGLPPTVAGLLTQLLMGGSVYAFAAALLWFAAGRPHGPEQTAIDWLRSLLAKRGRSPAGSGE